MQMNVIISEYANECYTYIVICHYAIWESVPAVFIFMEIFSFQFFAVHQIFYVRNTHNAGFIP